MSKVVKNSLIVIAIAILVFVIIYFVYDLLKAKPTYSEQVQQSNLEGSNMGIDTDKLFENVSTSNEEKTNIENEVEEPKENTEVLNGTVTSKEEKAIELAKKNGYTAVVSHRSGETEDTTLADVAVNSKGNYIVTVNDSKTSKTLAFYEIDVENEIVKEK